MSNSFAFYGVNKLSDYTQPIQLQIDGLREHPINPAKIVSTGRKIEDYVLYECRYDRKIIKSGYFYKPTIDQYVLPFDFYFEKDEFDAFYDENANILLFNCSYKTSDDMLKSIDALGPKAKNENIRLNKYSFDLHKIAINTSIRAAWISDLNQSNLSSTSVFGPDVKESQLYKQLVAEGKLSSITIKYYFEDKFYTIIISKNSSLSILDQIDSINTKIRLIKSIYNDLIS